MQLENKVAAVTGASSGIGKEIALALAREGATVTVGYRSNPDGAGDTVKQIEDGGGRAAPVHVDVSEPEDVKNFVGETAERFGRLDIMVNNAGMEEKHPFLEMPFEVWQKVVSVNLTGVWLGCQGAAKQMVSQGDGGHIINVSSVHEDLPMPTNAPYCAAKGGVRMLMRTIAVELAPHNITVNNIAPGAVATPINKETLGDDALMKELLSEIPLGRLAEPEEIGGLAVYLASDTASYVTGSTFFIDGGMMRQSGSL